VSAGPAAHNGRIDEMVLAWRPEDFGIVPFVE